MKTASIQRASMDAIVAQAEREFPFECCGFIIGDNDAVEEVRPIANIQNAMHAKDPAAFPRDARTAFLMEPKEHLAVMNEVDRPQARDPRRVPFASRSRRVLLRDRPRASVLVRSDGARLPRDGLYRDVDSRGQIRARRRLRLGLQRKSSPRPL